MEADISFGGVSMEKYCKPTIVGGGEINGIVPLALAGMAATELAVVGAAAGLGLAALGGRDYSNNSRTNKKLHDFNNIV